MRAELPVWLVRGAGLAVGVALAYALIWTAIAAGRVLLLVFVAILLACALEPFIDWVRSRVPIGRSGTILVVYASFFAVVAVLGLVVVPVAASQLEDVTAQLPPFFDRLREWAGGLRPGALGRSVGAIIDEGEALLRPPPPDPDELVAVGMSVAEAVGSVLMLLTIVFFWLVEHARLQRWVLSFLPLNRREGAREAWNEIEDRLGRFVRGQLILMATIGLMVTAACALLGVPSPLLLGLIAAIAQLVPIIGPLIGAIPAVIVAATVSFDLALVLTAAFAAIQFVQGNILLPIVLRNTIGLSPFLVIVVLLIGGAAGGFVGALIAAPIGAAALVILERLQARDVPVAQDPATNQREDEEAQKRSRTLPDAASRPAS
jgi:predicted PurR-regulated permease PerM